MATQDKDPMEKTKMALEKLREQNQQLQKEITATSELEADYDRLRKEQNKTEGRLSKLRANVMDKQSKSHRIAVDMGGGTAAQASTELINWGVRALGRWSKDGFFANNVDILQGGPHFFLGLGLYILEMATRKDSAEELPSTTREVLSEATKVFAQLGFNNVVRALRIRYADGQAQSIQHEALIAERDELRRQLAAAQQKK